MSGMRIIGGRYRGKRLASPEDRSIRPTSERAREALFNILDHAGRITDARFLDLFCGSGAVGLEAFSRGAGEVWLIDRNTTLASANANTLGHPPNVHIKRMDATRLGRGPCRFDAVFLDPPYQSNLVPAALASLGEGWLGEDALIIVELAAKENLDPPPSFALEDERRYGAAKFLFLRLDEHRSSKLAAGEQQG
ncbi:MAG: 16S rRNA (guanine(966)-N(2))-methyltransferase RsmD [Geminicoccaceae bacterium]